MEGKQKWDHGTDNTGRFRGGKTKLERSNGTHKARFENRQKPIRCTSSHKMGGQDNRNESFWGG